MVKGADLQLLPASFRAMEVDLGVEPITLAMMALCQGVAAAASGPMWGNLVDSGISRKWLLMVGTMSWGACTIALATVTSLYSMALVRMMNGLALAMLLPVTQSFVADLSRPGERGSNFGMLYFSTNIGQVLCCLFATPISNQRVLGHAGWRVALFVVGALSTLIVPLIPMMVYEEPRKWRPERLGPTREVRKLGVFLRIPTFIVIILQGVFGTIPGAALSFLTMYFQYTGTSDFSAALVLSFHVIGEACGGLLGGHVGDALANWSPRYGRALTAQISSLCAVPTVAALFLMVPRESQMTTAFAGILFLHGLLGSWVAPGCINPVMCDIVPRASLGSAYAWELAIVFCSGNLLGPLLVGVLSSHVFGYRLSTEQVDTMDPAVREQNARALGKSLFYSCAVPYMISTVIFLMLFVTHDADARRVGLLELSNSEADDELPGDGTAVLPNEVSRLVARSQTASSATC